VDENETGAAGRVKMKRVKAEPEKPQHQNTSRSRRSRCLFCQKVVDFVASEMVPKIIGRSGKAAKIPGWQVQKQIIAIVLMVF
jgi:hypothetical protein